MKKIPLVNIIIVTTDQFDYVGECIKSILSANYKNVKIYLVDNNSDKTKYLNFYNSHKENKKIKFFRLKKRKGFGGTCNYAIKKIKRGYIVLLNDDTIVTKNWLGPMIRYMQKNPEVGSCQPKIKNMRKQTHFEYAGAAGGFMDVYGYPFCRGRIFYTNEKDKGQYDNVVDVVWTSGNCFVTRASVFKKVGLLDENFYIYQDEADLCWRMHNYNFRMVYIPQSVVYHYGSGTFGKINPFKIYLHHRNTLMLLLKNYDRGEIIRYLPFRILLDFIAFWYYLVDNRLPMHSLAVMKAYIGLLVLIPHIIRSRRKLALKIKKKNKTPYPLYNGSIILDYFVRGKSKFTQLKYAK